MITENIPMGLGFFAQDIIHLISVGKSESIKEIVQHIANKDVVEYLVQKYDEEFSTKFNNSVYSNSEINKYFNYFIDAINGNEIRYKIMNDNDGLLLILALIAEIIEPMSRN